MIYNCIDYIFFYVFSHKINLLKDLKTKRLKYIDILRSTAIIMMLEGHFMTHSLQTVFRDSSNSVYAFWKFTRGLTAPLFLSISGLIFAYLLLQNKTQGWSNPRVQKGIKRSFTLIALGYFLQFNLYTHFFLNRPLFTSLIQIFHVLQCIGTSLLILISIYLLNKYLFKISFGFILLMMGLFVVILTPTLSNLNYQGVPRFIENILIVSTNTKLKVSVFPLFPWCSYVFFGGALGTLVYKLKDKANHILFPVGLMLSGIIVQNCSYGLLVGIQQLPLFNKLERFEYEYQPTRFCQVLLFIGAVILIQKIYAYLGEKFIFNFSKTKSIYIAITFFLTGAYLLTTPLEITFVAILAYSFFFIPIVFIIFKLVNWDHQTFLKIGQNTLFVYVVHVILLYQGFFGFRINALIKKQLTPFWAITGAILFVFFFLACTQYQDIYFKKIDSFKNKYRKQKIEA